MSVSRLKNILNNISEGGAVVVELSEPQNYPQEDCQEESEELDENLFSTKVKDGEVIKSKKDFFPNIKKVADLSNNADLVKARFRAKSPKANIKRRKSLRVRSRLVGEDVTLDVNSPLLDIPLRHFKYELNKTTPFVWSFEADVENNSIKVKVSVDKKAFGDKDVESLLLDIIKHNDTFKEFVDTLQGVSNVEALMDLSSWGKKESKNVVRFIKTLRLK